jgi:hypothetical protein
VTIISDLRHDESRPAHFTVAAAAVKHQRRKRQSTESPKGSFRVGALNKLNFSIGSTIRIRGGSDSGLECTDEPTLDAERWQCGGLRPFKRTELSACFVP